MTGNRSQAAVAIGIGYPYLGVRSDILSGLEAEIKYASSDGIQVSALRGYWDFYRALKFKGYVGAEGGLIGFNAQGLAGAGFEYGIFLGGEYKILENLGLTLDIGPALISLEAKEAEAAGVEWIVTTGIYFNVF